jgi:F-type H+-transporting ATPase subunit epsilon
MAPSSHPPGTHQGENIADALARPPGLLQVVVVSPERPLYQGDARWITVPGWDGQLGLWPRHADLLGLLGVGLVRIGRTDGKTDRFAVWGGFLKVTGPKVTVLVDRAAAERELDIAQARSELDATLAALRHPESDEQFQHLLEQRAYGKAKVSLAP